MPQVPSIKGGVFGLAVEDFRKLLKDGSISPHDAARWLEPLDLDVLDRPANPVE